jgi:ABC-type transporter Mla subunit MlaD
VSHPRTISHRVAVKHRRAVTRRRVLGALLLLCAALATYLLWRRPDPFASRETVRAELTDASGLAPIGADVRVAGVPVGKVTGVTRAGRLARLTLSVEKSLGEVHRDATVALQPRMMFEGTAYVELTLGSPAAPALGDAVIPSSQTATYVPLDDALSFLRAPIRRDVGEISQTAAGVLSRDAPAQLRNALAAAPDLTRDAAVVPAAARGTHAVELRSAVGSLSRVASAMAEQAPALGSSLGDSSRTAAALDTAAGRPLAETLDALPGTAEDLRTGADATTAIIAQAARLIPHLQPGVRQLEPTLTRVRPLLRRASVVTSALGPVLADAQRAIAGASRSAAPARAAIAALQPTLGIFQRTLLTALEQPTDLGDPAYLAFLGLFAGGGGASRPFGVDGQGHFMRFGLRFLTGAGQPLPPCTLLAKLSPSLAKTLATAGGCTS